MTTYKLVNPLILGDIETEYRENTAENAAKKVWNNLSQYITGNVPRFGFTLKDNSDHLHHFLVKEKVSKNKIVDYSIGKMDMKMTGKQENNFINHVEKLGKNINTQIGGRRKRYEDDSDSSDSDSDDATKYTRSRFYNNDKHPFYYWWYNPMLYTVYGSQYNSIYIPTFSVPFYPYIELDVSSAFFA